jgi:hypothetical protein
MHVNCVQYRLLSPLIDVLFCFAASSALTNSSMSSVPRCIEAAAWKANAVKGSSLWTITPRKQPQKTCWQRKRNHPPPRFPHPAIICHPVAYPGPPVRVRRDDPMRSWGTEVLGCILAYRYRVGSKLRGLAFMWIDSRKVFITCTNHQPVILSVHKRRRRTSVREKSRKAAVDNCRSLGTTDALLGLYYADSSVAPPLALRTPQVKIKLVPITANDVKT